MPEPSEADIDRLVFERHPELRLVEIAAATSASIYRNNPDKMPDFSSGLAQLESARAEFRALPKEELLAHIKACRTREANAQRKRDEAKRAAKDAARFFNQPSAMARFEVWCKVGFWTVDEAAALLLGRDPHIVNPDRLTQELNQVTGPFGLGQRPQRTEFHTRFDNLRLMLDRANGLSRPEMKPAEVIAWAERNGAVELQSKLLEALAEAPVSPHADPQSSAPAPEGQLQYIKRSALIRRYEMEWPTIESDLRHAAENGLSVAKLPEHGMWNELVAVDWAERHGKILRSQRVTATPTSGWIGRVHNIKG
jgi:hypothetical protein